MLRTESDADHGSLKTRILDRVNSRPDGVWTAIDFLDLGTRDAVDKALQRLVAAEAVRRIDRGLYDRPRINQLTGKTTGPNPRAVIDAVARRDQARVLVDPMTAANDLSLTTAVPARHIVLTDARLRAIRLGNMEIRFKTVAPSRLYWAGRPAMRVVQALYWVQDLLEGAHDDIIARLSAVLQNPEHGLRIREDLEAGLPTLPGWMQSIVRELLQHASAANDPQASEPSAGRRAATKRKKKS